MTQSKVEFQLDLSTQLNTSKEEEIDSEDVRAFINDLSSTKKKIQESLEEEVKNKEVKNMIIKYLSGSINDYSLHFACFLRIAQK